MWADREGYVDTTGTVWAYAKAAKKLGAEVVENNKVDKIEQRADGCWELHKAVTCQDDAKGCQGETKGTRMKAKRVLKNTKRAPQGFYKWSQGEPKGGPREAQGRLRGAQRSPREPQGRPKGRPGEAKVPSWEHLGWSRRRPGKSNELR